MTSVVFSSVARCVTQYFKYYIPGLDGGIIIQRGGKSFGKIIWFSASQKKIALGRRAEYSHMNCTTKPSRKLCIRLDQGKSSLNSL